VTQIANGLSTTTFAYDNNGNVTQKTVDGTTTTYVYDYANRLTALGVLGATTTYAYDAFGQRVLQTGTTTTYLYPFKWYSVASSTGTGAKFATTTDYVFNGDSLVATVDQQTASGNATGTAKTRYVHPDHLGSTNVVTDENDNVVQTLDYYPFGSTRISVATSTRERRQFIGQFMDDSTLSYLNARSYDGSRGQFISQDPIFRDTPSAQNLQDPQSLDPYSYAEDNPIVREDPTGRTSALIPGQGLVYDYNGTNESVCCTFSGPSGDGNVNPAPPPGTANGYLPTASNSFSTRWMPGYTSGTSIPSEDFSLGFPPLSDQAAWRKITNSISVGPAGELEAGEGVATQIVRGAAKKSVSEVSDLAKSIANGHASQHISQFAGLGVQDTEGFASTIQGVLDKPITSFTGFNGQKYFWGEGGIFMVTGQGIEGGGTVFIPSGGFSYYLRQFSNFRQ
jgi:RHS repeat-associated protein